LPRVLRRRTALLTPRAPDGLCRWLCQVPRRPHRGLSIISYQFVMAGTPAPRFMCVSVLVTYSMYYSDSLSQPISFNQLATSVNATRLPPSPSSIPQSLTRDLLRVNRNRPLTTSLSARGLSHDCLGDRCHNCSTIMIIYPDSALVAAVVSPCPLITPSALFAGVCTPLTPLIRHYIDTARW
jgi:hypothetical protein